MFLEIGFVNGEWRILHPCLSPVAFLQIDNGLLPIDLLALKIPSLPGPDKLGPGERIKYILRW